MNKEELVELLAKCQDAILERVDSKLQELKRSISEDQEECLSFVVKRVKEDNSIKWKKVGNEKQKRENGGNREASWPIDLSVVGPRFRLTLLTTWRTLLKTISVFLKLRNRQRRPLTLTREKSRVKSGSANYKSNHAFFSHVPNSRFGADDAVKSFRL